MAEVHLAQLNIARMRFALESPEMAGFVERLEDVNALADAAPGFVWRLQTEEGDATSIDYFGADMLVNMSVWRDLDSLRDFAFRTVHRELLARRHEWFEAMEEAYSVLWWIPAGKTPTLEEADSRLQALRRDGPSPRAFTFASTFDPD